MLRKAIIISLSGYQLTKKEMNLFKKNMPWGVILFKRNVNNYNQLKKLIARIRKVTKDKNYPIMIDEEGGTVVRLNNIIKNNLFSQKYFGEIYESSNLTGISLYKHYNNQICNILKNLGININTVPVLDKLYKETNTFLKHRIYSSKIKTIKNLSKVCIEIYNKNKILSVIKHIPGHGLAKSDSHFRLPIIYKSYKNLINNDFKCFEKTKSHLAMTAHVLFKKIDNDNCVTHSKFIINKIIRKKIGFKGILISDDISMKSLKSGILNNALKALSAGCNLTLYCKGNINESLKLLNKMPYIDNFTQKKTSEIYKFLS